MSPRVNSFEDAQALFDWLCQGRAIRPGQLPEPPRRPGPLVKIDVF